MTMFSLANRVARMATILGAAWSLAGCASHIRETGEVQATAGTAFTQALAEEYRALVAHEKEERDWSAADYFAVKGLAASRGQIVLPEAVPEAGAHTNALAAARQRLMASLEGGNARDGTPQAAALAQRAFDCWQHEAQKAHRNGTATNVHLATCRNEFEAVVTQLSVAIIEPPLNRFVVLFDASNSDVNHAGQVVIDGVLAQLIHTGSASISATGHTDTQGAGDYNMALSLRRADAVRVALIAGGIPADAISVAGRGESEPAVPTRDGVEERANRRVEIVIQ